MADLALLGESEKRVVGGSGANRVVFGNRFIVVQNRMRERDCRRRRCGRRPPAGRRRGRSTRLQPSGLQLGVLLLLLLLSQR